MSLNIEIGGVGANRHQEEQTLLLKGVVGKIRLKTLLPVLCTRHTKAEAPSRKRGRGRNIVSGWPGRSAGRLEPKCYGTPCINP